MTDAAPASGEFRPLSRRDWIGLSAILLGLLMAVLAIQTLPSSLGRLAPGPSATTAAYPASQRVSGVARKQPREYRPP